ncbi:uncharacterized protein LOC120260563 [Dioscorea cayenensis subsp. rotundata]|uniref:Uncharacterized protein LOC120260563 n=1 Tax=Dioscorea cayennensis subsp. rotundata TaxID=55577 RepID=A0AB40B9S7_DIOCR|nr:uncharacterized protein LOC120260563 [Dioscorea cayenensis subsp. rotundata]
MMARRSEFLVLVAIVLILIHSSAGAGMSAYEVLRVNGLPSGLLPKGVREFSIGDDGSFEAHLDHPCLAKFENHVLYQTNISGSISFGRISSISGVSAQELFLWFPVKAIVVDDPLSGVIFFDVGDVRKQFPISTFDTPPDCAPTDEEDVLALHRAGGGVGVWRS